MGRWFSANEEGDITAADPTSRIGRMNFVVDESDAGGDDEGAGQMLACPACFFFFLLVVRLHSLTR